MEIDCNCSSMLVNTIKNLSCDNAIIPEPSLVGSVRVIIDHYRLSLRQLIPLEPVTSPGPYIAF